MDSDWHSGAENLVPTTFYFSSLPWCIERLCSRISLRTKLGIWYPSRSSTMPYSKLRRLWISVRAPIKLLTDNAFCESKISCASQCLDQRCAFKSMSQYIAFAAVDCEHTTVSLRISVAFRHIVIGNTLSLVTSACISQHAWESCDYSVCAQVPDSTHLCFSYISRTISAFEAFAKFI